MPPAQSTSATDSNVAHTLLVATASRATMTTMPPRRVAILDTDVVVDDLIAYAADPVRGSLLTKPLGSTRWVASSHVYREMYKSDALGNRHKFDKIAGQLAGTPCAISAEELRHVFETCYLPMIMFVDVTGVMTEHPMAVAVEHADVKDKPTGQLAALMEAAGFLVLSRDHSLRNPGLAPADIQPVIVDAKSVGDAELMVSTTVVVGGVTVQVMSATASGVARRLASPNAVGWGLIAAVALWVGAKPARRAKLRRGAQVVATMLSEMIVAGEVGRERLAAVFVEPVPTVPLECRVAKVLVFAQQPLLVREVRELLEREGHPLPAAADSAVRELLRSMPCFVEAPRHRWGLGCTYDPQIS